jgi:hypothetical protein
MISLLILHSQSRKRDKAALKVIKQAGQTMKRDGEDIPIGSILQHYGPSKHHNITYRNKI